MTGSSTVSVADTRASMRTLDKERIRQRALYLNMKEKLRMSICVRIQKQCKKPPALASELASQILETLQKQGASSNLTDTELQRLVQTLCKQGTSSLSTSSVAKASTPPGTVAEPVELPIEKPKSQKKMRKPNSSKEGPRPLPAPDSIYVTESQLQQASIGFVLPPRKSPKKHKQDDIWNALVKIQNLEEVHEAESKMKKKVAMRSSWSHELQSQVDAKEMAKQAEAQDNQKYFEETMRKLERMNDAERAKELDRIARAKEQNKIQEEQRQYKLEKKRAEVAARHEAEVRMAEAIAKQKTDDEAKDAARKQAEKLKMARVLEENEAQLRKKANAMAADRELEVKLAHDYVKMEEAKEAQRQQNLDALSKKIQAKMKFFDDTSKAETDMRNKEDEMRILRYQEANESAFRCTRLIQHAMRRNHDQQQYLKQQMLLKKERERLEKEDYDKQADLWRADREKDEKRQRQVDMQRAAKNQLQQAILKQQMLAKEEEALLADHTTLEVQLNQTLLHKLEKLATVADATRQRSRELDAREKASDAKQRAKKVKGPDPRLQPASRK